MIVLLEVWVVDIDIPECNMVALALGMMHLNQSNSQWDSLPEVVEELCNFVVDVKDRKGRLVALIGAFLLDKHHKTSLATAKGSLAFPMYCTWAEGTMEHTFHLGVLKRCYYLRSYR